MVPGGDQPKEDWRESTERMLARRSVGAIGRHQLMRLSREPSRNGRRRHGRLAPVEGGDERVDALVSALDGPHWRGWSLAWLCTELSSALEAWQAARDSFDSDLRQLEGH
jgi:hypothetical protein